MNSNEAYEKWCYSRDQYVPPTTREVWDAAIAWAVKKINSKILLKPSDFPHHTECEVLLIEYMTKNATTEGYLKIVSAAEEAIKEGLTEMLTKKARKG